MINLFMNYHKESGGGLDGRSKPAPIYIAHYFESPNTADLISHLIN